MKLEESVRKAIEWCDAHGVDIPRAVLIDAANAFKTVDYFLRVLNGLVVDLFRGDITESEFVDSLADLIPQQLRRAFNEGMRQNGLDPIEDMQPEWEQAFQNIVVDEFSYVDRFAADIVAGRDGNMAQFQARAQLWANRYNDVVNQAIMITAEGADRLMWKVGPTKEHCDTCSSLDGIVAFAREWEISGFSPQGDMLDCGGWRCKCRLEPTDQRRSPNALTTLLNIGTKI